MKRLSAAEFRTTAFFFTLFMSLGAANSFSGIWFASRGLSEAQIGVIGAVPIIAMLVLNLIVGRLADRAKDWRQTIVAGSVLAGVFSLAMLGVAGFYQILVVWALTSAAQLAMAPVADAAAMRMVRRTGGDYGFIRAWGTIGYIATVLATGFLVARYGPDAFVAVFVAVAVLRALVSFWLPAFRASADTVTPSRGASSVRQVMRPWFILPLAGYALVFATHLVLNFFQALLWREQGIGDTTIGILVAIGAVAEAFLFFGFRHIALRVSARRLILVSAVTSVIRWLAMAFSPGIALLVPLQMLDAITYALGFAACVSFVANWTAEEIAAEAQSFFVMLQQATAILAILAFGWLAGSLGAHTYLLSALLAAVGAGMIWLSLRLQPSVRR